VPRRSRPSALAGVATALAVAAPASANEAGSVTHSAGDVAATAEWDRDANLGVSNPRLFVVRAGVRYDITIVDICDVGCVLAPDDPGTKAGQSVLKVADLDGDGEPEVLIDTFSGGAHCCVTTRLLTWNGSGYTPTDTAWRDVGYELRDADGDGRQELVGFDPRFSEAFTYFAGSSWPRVVLQVDKGAFTDVTRRFGKVVAADAKAQLADLRRAAARKQDVRGLLAAYVADLYNLGKRATAGKELDRQRAQGRISKGFKRLVLRRLAAWGYPVT
jgi:hypothetical protein